MGCSNSKQPSEEELAEQRRKDVQMTVEAVKANRANDQSVIAKDSSKAAVKIQKMFRRTATQKAVAFQTNWKIFNELKQMSEMEELLLVDFLQTMMNHCPQLAESEMKATVAGPGSGSLRVDSIAIDDNANDEKAPEGDLMNYYISPSDPITVDIARNIVSLYRKGGKMNVRSVHHIADTAYKAMKRMANTNRVSINDNDKLTVVGDLNGQLEDILQVLDDSGWPSTHHKYIFNGGFVGRGSQSVEVLTIVFALLVAFPNIVFLNRGCQEDQSLASACGVQKEVTKKYDQGLFIVLCEAFRYIPLFSIVNDAIFIVHGGLFHEKSVTLDKLETINRMDYKPEKEDPNSDKNRAFPEGCVLKKLQQDALWSDAQRIRNHNFDKVMISPSGLGVTFGPTHTLNFLNKNNLKMIVRSHEAVPNGFDLPFQGTPQAHKLCTVFTTSNFGNSGNQAAFLVFHTHEIPDAVQVEGIGLWYSVISFSSLKDDAQNSARTEKLMHELILKKWNALKLAFQGADVDNTGYLPKAKWSQIMREVTKINVLWMQLAQVLVPPGALRSMGHEIGYMAFLDRFKKGAEDELNVEGMYLQQKKIEAIFRYFDSDGDGTISKAEFRQGFDVLNQSLPPHMQLYDPDAIMKLMDIDGNDGVDMNEFFEVFRLLGIKDGKKDS